jgi:signal peptidase I
MGPQPPPLLQYSPLDLRPRRAGKGFMAVCGTFVFWGLGHLLCGRPRRALGWFVAWLLVLAASLVCLLVPRCVAGLIVLVPLQIVLLLAALVDAFVTGRSSERVYVQRAWQRYLAGVALLVLAVVLGRFVRGYVLLPLVEAFIQPTKGMAPTINPGDRFLAHKRLAPHRWDLIVFHPPVHPNEVFVQRVVGLPGEKVEIVGGEVRINDVPRTRPGGTQPYLGRVGVGNNGCEGHPIVLGPDEYYMLGDNTTISYDSRWWTVSAPGHQLGAVPASDVVGVVTTLYWPLARWRRF